MGYEWYFAENSSPSNEVADKLIDSKFGIEKVSSFVREIIQNSLDAHDDKLENLPVIVDFSIKELKLSEIPGGKRLKEILNKCLNVDELNHQTSDMYNKGIQILESDKIMCLKISDENTIGVEPGLKKSWGAFVYDEGVSRKIRPGSAGSHGVGKKAPFIISGVHTVFYSTRYKDKRLFEGKTSLVNWSENNIDYDYRGWFGMVNHSEKDRRNKVLPIEYEEGIEGVNDFFLRKDKAGTDVIIIDASSIGKIEEAKYQIIISILENFFVAILNNKLECVVFGENISSSTIDDIINKYYFSKNRGFKRITDSDKVYDGNLKDYYRVFKNNMLAKNIDLIVDGKKYGYIELYFDMNNEKNKKYFCIVREHGMKITDRRVDCDQPFTAVALIKDYRECEIPEGERINARLAARENAAHDDFIVYDEQVPCDSLTKKLIEMMFNEIRSFICSMTALKIEKESFLNCLSDMLDIPGGTTKGNTKKNTPKIKKKKSMLLEPGKGKESDKDDNTGVSMGKGGKGNGGKGKKKVVIDGEDVSAYLYTNFTQEPIFLHYRDKYRVKFIPNNNGKAFLSIKPISVDGGECTINNIVKSARQNDNDLVVKGNVIKGVKIKQGQQASIDIFLQDGLDYVLSCDVLMEVNDED